eukprot:155010-Pyramimonas_sp.AAC.1
MGGLGEPTIHAYAPTTYNEGKIHSQTAPLQAISLQRKYRCKFAIRVHSYAIVALPHRLVV